MEQRYEYWGICKSALLAGAVFCGGLGTASAQNVIVDTDYVVKSKDKPGVVVVDARDAAQYRKGLIPGAVVLGEHNGAKELRDVNARILPLKKLEKILGDAGIKRDNEIIVYGDKGDTSPSVVFWILEYLGVEKAKIYMGGIDDWKSAKQHLTNEVRKLPPAQFSAKVRPELIATTDYVRKSLKDKNVQFLDARTAKEAAGDDIRSVRGGHIDAVNYANIPYEAAWVDPEASKKLREKKVLDRDGMALKDTAGLKELYKGIDPNKEVVAYCQTGTRSTQTYAVLRNMGYKKVRNYDDSWIVYGADPTLPVANVTYFDFVKANQAISKIDALEKKVEELAARK